MLSGNNSILSKAGEAKKLSEERQIAERVQVAYLGVLDTGKGEVKRSDLLSALQNEFGEDKINDEDIANDLSKVTIDGIDYSFDGIVTPGSEDGDEIDIATLQTDTTKPYLPSNSFKVSSESGEQSVSNGLVITDGTNEFVWVEVPITDTVYPTAGTSITEDATTKKFTDAEYLRIAQDLRNYSGSTLNNTSLADHIPPAGDGVPDYTSAYKEVLQSIYKNGGFYVGRYETGIQGTENATESVRNFGNDYSDFSTEHSISGNSAVIKANVQPYNWTRWVQAQNLAQGISSGNRTSSLLMGVQWDLVLKFIGKNGDTDSSNWGNYRDSEFDIERGKYVIYKDNYTLDSTWTSEDTLNYVSSGKKAKNTGWSDTKGLIIYTTGANRTKNSIKNICDIAGNVCEWTIENTSYSDNPCSIRGGDFFVTGSLEPASNHEHSSTSESRHCRRISCFTLLT